MVSQAELILKVITLWFLVLSQFFIDGMGPFKEGEKKVEKDCSGSLQRPGGINSVHLPSQYFGIRIVFWTFMVLIR